MEQNNFEKNIQQKLDEFSIHPSDSVWLNVEKRIEKKHKDRKMIFIFFFLFLFLLSGGYWLFNLSENNQQQNQPVSNEVKVAKEKSNLSAIIKTDSSLNTRVISSGANPQKNDVAGVTAKKAGASPIVQSVISKDKYHRGTVNKNQKQLPVEIVFNPKEKIAPEKNAKNEIGNEKGNKIPLTNPDHLPVEKPLASENENSHSNNSVQNKPNQDSLSDQAGSEKIAKEIVTKKDSFTKQPVKNSSKNRWVLGITFSGGESRILRDPFEINNLGDNYAQNLPGSGSIGNGGNPSPSVFNPSKMNSSVAFIVGAFIEKNISAESKISLGFSYKYFSLINKVGASTGSALYQFSAGNTINSYRNNFHFLELPVSFKFQLNNGKSLPLYWQVGMNISRLISSNALQFQASPGLYFNDNSMLNKMQLGLSTGISAVLFSKQKVPVTIGPYFYYSATKLSDKGLYQNRHFSFIGIQAEIALIKK